MAATGLAANKSFRGIFSLKAGVVPLDTPLHLIPVNPLTGISIPQPIHRKGGDASQSEKWQRPANPSLWGFYTETGTQYRPETSLQQGIRSFYADTKEGKQANTLFPVAIKRRFFNRQLISTAYNPQVLICPGRPNRG